MSRRRFMKLWKYNFLATGGLQRLVPRVQLVLTPPTTNLDIPNEDARSVDLEDSNLFALNRFPGYDRWEDRSRVTYGVDWAFERPSLSIENTIGQSYRLTSAPGIFPDGTGLTGRVSDIVGRTRVRFGRPIPAGQRYARGSQKRSRSDGRHSTDLCANRLLTAQPEHRSDDRGPSRQGGATGGGARVVQPLLVDLRCDRDRPHRQERGPAVARKRFPAGSLAARDSI